MKYLKIEYLKNHLFCTERTDWLEYGIRNRRKSHKQNRNWPKHGINSCWLICAWEKRADWVWKRYLRNKIKGIQHGQKRFWNPKSSLHVLTVAVIIHPSFPLNRKTAAMNKLPVLTAITVLLSACQPSGNNQSADTPAGKAVSAPAEASSAGTSAAAPAPVAASDVQAASVPQASGIPVVGTASAVLYDKTQCVQGHPTYCAKSNIRLPQTGIAWLDTLLKQQLYEDFSAEGQPAVKSDAALRKLIDHLVAESADGLKDYAAEKSAINELYDNTDFSFQYQRGRLATFRLIHDSYSGGAHNNYAESYVTVDLEKRRVLNIADIVAEGKMGALDALLQKRYDEFILADNQEYDGNNGSALIRQHKETFSKKAELTDSFELTADGLAFHYSPYEIAPFAAGVVKLTVAPDELKGILRPEYLP